MRLSQSSLFHLCCASFLAGLCLALFYDLLAISRLYLQPFHSRYSVPKIQKIQASRGKNKKSKPSKGVAIVLFAEDVLFCLVGAVTIILILYWLNNGAFRVIAPLCMSFGFLLWRVSVSKGARAVLQWIAFGIETLFYILLLPIKRLFTRFIGRCRYKTQIRRKKRLAKQRQTYTKLELQHIESAAQRLFPIDITGTSKGETRANKRKKAV